MGQNIKYSISSKTHDLIQTDFKLSMRGKKSIQNLKSKSLYDSFSSKISSIPTALKKYNGGSFQYAHIPVRLGKDISQTALQRNIGD